MLLIATLVTPTSLAKVSEVIPSGATDIGGNYKVSGDMAYDSNEYIIAVHTKRTSSGGIGIKGYTVYKADGTTKVTEMDYDSGKPGVVTFDNRTLSNEAKVTLKATKSFNSDEWPADGFTFTLNKVSCDKGNGVQTSGLEYAMDPPQWKIDQNQYKMSVAATKGSPVVSWGELSFNENGTYCYSIKENIPDGAEVSADGKTAVKDGITYDNETGEVLSHNYYKSYGSNYTK